MNKTADGQGLLRWSFGVSLALAASIAGCGGGKAAPGAVPDGGGADTGGGSDVPGSGSIDAPAGVETMEMNCRTLTPPPSGLCTVTAGAGALLLEGTVLAPGVVYRGGQVALDGAGKIACVGCDCTASAPDATHVSCPRGVISPGLINTHDHITFSHNVPFSDTGERYEHRHDWRSGVRGHTALTAPGSATPAQVSWGELRFLMGGATSIVGSGGRPGFLRNLDQSAQQEGLGHSPARIETFPLDDSNGRLLSTGCGYPKIDTVAMLAPLVSYLPHLAEGIDAPARNEFVCTSRTTEMLTGAQDLLESKTAIVQGIALTAPDLAEVAAAGAKLIWSPRSNIALYGDTAQVTVAARLGVPIALGTDWIVSGSMNLLRELKCADELNTRAYDRFFSDEALWRMVTSNAAVAAGFDDVLGTLAQGKMADLVIFDGSTHDGFRAVIDAAPADVALVVRGGKPLYGDAALLSALAPGCDDVDVCGSPKGLCAMSEVGMPYATLAAAVGAASYPAFSCDTPQNEPACTPKRSAAVNGSTVYGGVPSADDSDGDGLANGADNCPKVFNPIRPVDNGMQGDSDADGVGDPCDPTPVP